MPLVQFIWPDSVLGSPQEEPYSNRFWQFQPRTHTCSSTHIPALHNISLYALIKVGSEKSHLFFQRIAIINYILMYLYTQVNWIWQVLGLQVVCCCLPGLMYNPSLAWLSEWSLNRHKMTPWKRKKGLSTITHLHIAVCIIWKECK